LYQVLELPLDRVDAQTVGQRREDLERLLGLLVLLLLGHRADRAHVVEAIGELDQDDPDVLGHRDHHLAVVLGLAIVTALEGDSRELGHAVHQGGDLLAEPLVDLVERGARVLDRVVQQRRAERGRVQAHARADLRHADRMDDEVLTARALLLGMALAGEHERLLDRSLVDLLGGVRGVLLDDREQVTEEDALVLCQAGLRSGRGVLRRLIDAAALEAPLRHSRGRARLAGTTAAALGRRRSLRPLGSVPGAVLRCA
jgi:hypothetical protein